MQARSVLLFHLELSCRLVTRVLTMGQLFVNFAWSHERMSHAVPVLDRYMWKQLTFVARLNGCGKLQRQRQSIRAKHSLRVSNRRSFFCLRTISNNIVKVNQYLMKPTGVFLPDARDLNRSQAVCMFDRTCGSCALTRAPDYRHSCCTRYHASAHLLHLGQRNVSRISGTLSGCHQGKKRERATLQMQS